MSLGKTLREARERKGYTTEYVAEQTRMMRQLVEELEQDDFHRIVAAIYGRGFIKLYAECVEISPEPLLAEFNETYKGFRHLGTRPEDVKRQQAESEHNHEAPKAKKLSFAHNDDGFEFADNADAAPGVHPTDQKPISPASVNLPESNQDHTSTASSEVNFTPIAAKQESIPAPQTQTAEKAPTAAKETNLGTTTSKFDTPVEPTAITSTENTSHIEPTSVEEPEPEVPPRVNLFNKLEEKQSEEQPAVVPEPQVSDIETSEHDSGLGELFELGNMSNDKSDETATAIDNKTDVGEGPHARIPVINPAPSWDDDPLEEGNDPWWRQYINICMKNTKVITVAAGGLVILISIILAVTAGSRSRSKKQESPASVETPAVAVAETAPAVQEATPVPVENSVVDKSAISTRHILPPPDSYVE